MWQLSHSNITYRRNETEVKKYTKASEGRDQPATGGGFKGGIADAEFQSYP